jgi:hypothetical protein
LIPGQETFAAFVQAWRCQSLRPRDDGRFGLVHDSYVHGVMDGEMEQLHKAVSLEDIILV